MMINNIFKNKSGGDMIQIVNATALDYRAKYIDDSDSDVEFSLTREELKKYWIQQETSTAGTAGIYAWGDSQ